MRTVGVQHATAHVCSGKLSSRPFPEEFGDSLNTEEMRRRAEDLGRERTMVKAAAPEGLESGFQDGTFPETHVLIEREINSAGRPEPWK